MVPGLGRIDEALAQWMDAGDQSTWLINRRAAGTESLSRSKWACDPVSTQAPRLGRVDRRPARPAFESVCVSVKATWAVGSKSSKIKMALCRGDGVTQRERKRPFKKAGWSVPQAGSAEAGGAGPGSGVPGRGGCLVWCRLSSPLEGCQRPPAAGSAPCGHVVTQREWPQRRKGAAFPGPPCAGRAGEEQTRWQGALSTRPQSGEGHVPGFCSTSAVPFGVGPRSPGGAEVMGLRSI